VQKAWHGGGYQYRLCPADAELTEECFQSHPVPFADGTSTLRWAGKNGETVVFNATDVSVGTLPEGSTWRRGPFPRGAVLPLLMMTILSARNKAYHDRDYSLI